MQMRSMIWVFGLVVAVTAMMAPQTPSQAFSQKEIADAAYHWGRVDFAAETCARMAVNDGVRSDVSASLAKLGKDSWDSGYKLGQTEGREYHDIAGKAAFCELAWAFYGRNGQMAKNLLLRR